MDLAQVGFIGCGAHSTKNLFPALHHARCRLRAVCDLNRDFAERNARLFGAQAVYTDADEMLAKEELDGVFVVGPAELHYQMGLKVLRRGLPLFVEKPPAPDLASARELVEAAREHKTFIMTGFMKRHGLAYAKVREFILEKRFVPATGFFKYLHWPAKNLRSMLMTMSIHPIDLAISFFGEPTEVTSHLHEHPDALSLALTLRFDGGRWAQLMLGGFGPRIQEHAEWTGRFDGKDALLVADNIQHLELHTHGRNGIDRAPKGRATDLHDVSTGFDLQDIQVWRPDYGLQNLTQSSLFSMGYAGEIREFANAIVEKREPNPGTGDVLKAMRVAEAVFAKPIGTTVLEA
ncbi:MAG: Gfo/Idh/MocA family oxidoreductase [Planctomycetota bacterium]|nr:Gfo/Idh/MocA family oxidoreductase [Planctomycetota bacterium]